MSADSPRRASGSSRNSNMPSVVPPQVVSDRSILDSAIGFINDVTLVHQPHTDPKDTITWARFETLADISDPRFGEDWELEGNVAPPLLLILGYGLGVQVWAIPANGEAVEVLSWRHGIVSALRILPTPGVGHIGVIDESHTRADEQMDAFVERRPLMALVDGSTATGAQPQFCAVNFVSLKTGTQVKTIKFKNPVLDVLANRSSVVITFHERIAIFDALTLEDRLSITTCFPSPGINPNPVALGPRWLAYAEHKLIHSKRSSAGCDGEAVASYTATMLNAAKSLGKGLRELGEQVAAGLTGTAGSAGSSKSGSFESGCGPDAKQPGIITILDIKNPIKDYSPTSATPLSGIQNAGNDPIVAHFIAHSEALVAMEFDNSGMLLVTADRRGHDFHLFRIQPHPVGASLAAVQHLYVLHRGDTSAKVQNIVFSLDSRWVAVSTLRGTTHVFPITPYGGAMGVRTHTSLHVVNKLSRFHRSAGLSADGRSSSPISHSESTTFVQSLQPYHNPTLPPFPRPTVVLPLAQLRQPLALGSPPGSAGLSATGKSGGNVGAGSTQRQRLSSLSDDSGKPLSVCAIFAKSRSWLLDPPNVTREPSHRIQRKAVDSIFVMAGHGALIQYDLDTKLASNVAKEKICDDTPIELDVEAKAQWNLGRRREGSQELMPPLSMDNWLIRDRNSCILTDSTRQYDDSDDRTESWLSQVEIITHAGPHRRLWMGPQCVFKTYNTPSGSNLNHVDAEAVEIGVTKSTTSTTSAATARTDISSPLNITATGRAGAVPVLIESGSYSSIEQSPKLMDRFRHDHLDSDYAVAHGDSRLKEDLADAMRESPSVSVTHKLAGRFLSSHAASSENIPFYDALAEHEQEFDDDNDSNATNYDDFADSSADQQFVVDTTQSHSGRVSSTAVAALASALPNIYSYETTTVTPPSVGTSSAAGSGYESLESLTRQKASIEKVVNPLGTVTTVMANTSTAAQADILDEVVSQLAAEDCVIHENCDEALFRPVVAIFCDKSNPAAGGDGKQPGNVGDNETAQQRDAEEKRLRQPPEAVGNKLIVPVIAKEVDAELCKKEKEKSLNSKAKQKQQQLKQNLQKSNQIDEEHPKFAEFSSLNKIEIKNATEKFGSSKDSTQISSIKKDTKTTAELIATSIPTSSSKKGSRKNSREESYRILRDSKSPEVVVVAPVVDKPSSNPVSLESETKSTKTEATKKTNEKIKTIENPKNINTQMKLADDKTKKSKDQIDTDNSTTSPLQDDSFLTSKKKNSDQKKDMTTATTTIKLEGSNKDVKVKTELLSSKNLRDSLIEISANEDTTAVEAVKSTKSEPDKKVKTIEVKPESEVEALPSPEEIYPALTKTEAKKKKQKLSKSDSSSEIDEIVVKSSKVIDSKPSTSSKASLEKKGSWSSDESSYTDLADSLIKDTKAVGASFAKTIEKSKVEIDSKVKDPLQFTLSTTLRKTSLDKKGSWSSDESSYTDLIDSVLKEKRAISASYAKTIDKNKPEIDSKMKTSLQISGQSGKGVKSKQAKLPAKFVENEKLLVQAYSDDTEQIVNVPQNTKTKHSKEIGKSQSAKDLGLYVDKECALSSCDIGEKTSQTVKKGQEHCASVSKTLNNDNSYNIKTDAQIEQQKLSKKSTIQLEATVPSASSSMQSDKEKDDDISDDIGDGVTLKTVEEQVASMSNAPNDEKSINNKKMKSKAEIEQLESPTRSLKKSIKESEATVKASIDKDYDISSDDIKERTTLVFKKELIAPNEEKLCNVKKTKPDVQLEQPKSPKKSTKQLEVVSPPVSPVNTKNIEKPKVISEQPRMRKELLPSVGSPTKNEKTPDNNNRKSATTTDEIDFKILERTQSKPKLSSANVMPSPSLPSAWKSMSGSEMINNTLISSKIIDDNYPSLGKITPTKTKKLGNVKLAFDDVYKPEMPQTVTDKLIPDIPTPIKSTSAHFKEPLKKGNKKSLSHTGLHSDDDFPALEALPPLPDLEPLGDISSPLRPSDNPWKQQNKSHDEVLGEQVSLINFESPLQENPELDGKIIPTPRGFTERNLIFAMCGSLHYENKNTKSSTNSSISSENAPAVMEVTPSPTHSSIIAGIDFKTLGEESYHSIDHSSQDTTNTTTKFSSSANSSASEDILIVEERTMTKKQRRKKQQQQQLDVENIKEKNLITVTPAEDEELRPLIGGGSGMSDSQLETYVDTMISSVDDGITTYNNQAAGVIGPSTMVLDDSFNIKTVSIHSLQQPGNNSTTTDSEGPMPATTSDDNVIILPSTSCKSTTPHKLKTKKLEHKINLIAAIEAATSSSSTSSAEESGVETGRRSPEMDGSGIGVVGSSLITASATPVLSLPHQLLPTAVMGGTSTGAHSATKKKTKRRKR